MSRVDVGSRWFIVGEPEKEIVVEKVLRGREKRNVRVIREGACAITRTDKGWNWRDYRNPYWTSTKRFNSKPGGYAPTPSTKEARNEQSR